MTPWGSLIKDLEELTVDDIFDVVERHCEGGADFLCYVMPAEHEDSCTMCGKMCAVRTMNRVLAGLIQNFQTGPKQKARCSDTAPRYWEER
jgi:thiamine biosynthesis protein ThiC